MIEGIRTLQLRWISLHEKDSINTEAFLTVNMSGRMARQEYMVSRARSLHEPL